MPLVRVGKDFEEQYPGGSRSATECAVNVIQLADRVQKAIGRLQRPYDVTPASGYALSILSANDEPMSPNDIADQMILTRATVTGILDSLERRKYVTRAPHPTDRRRLLVTITDKGREAVPGMRQIIHRHQRDWFDVLTEEERQTLLGLVERVQDRVAQFDGQ